MMCKCRFIDYKKHSTVVWDVDSVVWCGNVNRGIWESLYLPVSFAVNPMKTSLK